LQRHLRILAICTALVLAGCGFISGAAESSPIDTGKVEARTDDELGEQKIVLNQVDAAIAANDFAALDKLERQYRTSRARAPSGVWKLGVFHAEVQFNLTKGMSPENGCAAPGASFVAKWLRHDPVAPAAIITSAALSLRKAWCIRGGGYSGSVPEQAWPRFNAAIDDGFKSLTSARTAASIDPEYYAVMAKIYRSRGADQTETMALVREATNREPYYSRIYFEAVMNFLPQWGGSMAEVDQFARYASERTRTSDKLGYYARVYWVLDECGCADIAKDADWDTLKQAMHDVVERYPAPSNAKYFMDLLCKRGDVDAAMPFIRLLTPTALSDADRITWIDGCKNSAEPPG
jgi:hypothetical protein